MRLALENLSDNVSVSLDCVTYDLEYFVDIVAYFCPNCGTESFGAAMYVENNTSRAALKNYGLESSDIMKRHNEVSKVFDAYNAKMSNILSNCKCPFCGMPLSEETGYKGHLVKEIPYRSILLTADVLNPVFAKMESARMEQVRTVAKNRAINLVNQYNEAHKFADILVGNGAEIASSQDTLFPYIGHLMHLEMGIYSTELHLAELYEGKERFRFELFRNTGALVSEHYSAVEAAEWELEELEDEHDSFVSISWPKTQYAPKPQQPQKPIFKESKPQEPSYEKPGLFNKKKVLAENEAKKAAYEQELAQYNQKQAAYQVAMAAYNEAMTQYKIDKENWTKDCQARDEAATIAYKEAVQQKESLFQAKVEAVRRKIAAKKAELASLGGNPDDHAGMVLISKEIADGEKLLGELIAARNKMYSLNVIYPKYRNLVAISSIYDYLVSGRCSVLTGSDGAYSLFESESKTNLILTRLADVVSSLEKIQENQYLLYQQISEINSGIQTLNQSMEKVVTSLAKLEAKADDMTKHLTSIDNKATAIGSSVASIAENTEVMAHYSRVSAFYAKRNAELTDALGYMVAFR